MGNDLVRVVLHLGIFCYPEIFEERLQDHAVACLVRQSPHELQANQFRWRLINTNSSSLVQKIDTFIQLSRRLVLHHASGSMHASTWPVRR